MNLLHVCELIPDLIAIATTVWIAPRHNAAICQNCSKRVPCGMDLLHILELIPYSCAVAPKVRIAPCDDTTSRAPQGHRTIGCSYFGLLCYSCYAVSTLKPGILKEVPLDSKVVHPGQQVWGKLAPKTAAPPISDPKRCRPVVAIARHTGHWATTHSVAGCWPVPHNCFLAAPQRPGPHRSSCAFCFRGPWRIWPTQWQETMAHVDVTFLANSLSMFKLALI